MRRVSYCDFEYQHNKCQKSIKSLILKFEVFTFDLNYFSESEMFWEFLLTLFHAPKLHTLHFDLLVVAFFIPTAVITHKDFT